MRTIHVTVTGDAVTRDSAVAGVQGSGNVDKLVVSFDPAWDGYAKSAAWWDAHGKEAGEPKLLTADLLVDYPADTRTYVLLVPPEALRCSGECTLVIDGWRDGALARTVRQTFQVAYAPPSAKGSDLPPSKAQDLQAQIDGLLDDIAQRAQGADRARAEAQTAVSQAQGARDAAYGAAEEAGATLDAVRQERQNAVEDWLEYRDQASGRADAAERSAQRAADSATQAEDAACEANAALEGAQTARDQAIAARQETQAIREATRETYSMVSEIAGDASDYSDEARMWGKNAQEARDEAIAARDQAVAAQGAAQALALKPAYIGANGNWQVWDEDLAAYQDSGVAAQGEPGPEGPPGPAGASLSMRAGAVTVGSAGARINTGFKPQLVILSSAENNVRKVGSSPDAATYSAVPRILTSICGSEESKLTDTGFQLYNFTTKVTYYFAIG